MLTVLGDTHGRDDHRLTGRTLEAVRAAGRVVHTGDFTTTAVYDAIAGELAADATFTAVAGNNEDDALSERLPSVATVEWGEFRFVVVHGHDHEETGLSMLARQENADVVVVGHSHRPTIESLGAHLLVNPGSHADPRRFRPAHVECERTREGLRVRLCQPDGAVLTEVSRLRETPSWADRRR